MVEVSPLEAAPELVVPGQDPGALAAQQRVLERIGVALAVRDAPLRLALQVSNTLFSALVGTLQTPLRGLRSHI